MGVQTPQSSVGTGNALLSARGVSGEGDCMAGSARIGSAMAYSPGRPLSAKVWLLGLLGMFSQACYDHRITQAILEHRRHVKAAEGAQITARASARPITMRGRIKLYVAQDYRQQHPPVEGAPARPGG